MSADVFIVTTEKALSLLGGVMREVAAHRPRAGLQELANEVSQAVGAICEARDHRRDPLGALEAAQARVLVAAYHAAGSPLGLSLAAAAGELLTASRFAPIFAPAPVPRARISVGFLPTLHVRRGALSPAARALPLPKPRPAPTAPTDGPTRITTILASLKPRSGGAQCEAPAADESAEPPELPSGDATPGDALDALIEAGEPVDALAPDEDSRAFERGWARDLFDEIAALGMQRLPLADDDPWARGFAEERLLSAVDAFIGLGDAAFGCLETLVRDAPVPDPWRLFALGLIAGHAGGRDLAFLFEAALRELDLEDPDTFTAWVSAARLVSSQAVHSMMRSLLEAELPLRAFGLVGLAVSGAASSEELLDAARGDSPRLVEIALAELAHRRVQAAAPIALGLLSRGGAGAVERAACEVLFALSDPGLAPHLLRRAREPEADWVPLIAGATGDAALAQEFETLAQQAPTIARLLGLGWAGRTSSLTLLLDSLDHPDEDLGSAAARALARILGEAPIVEREVEPEALADPDVPIPRAAREDADRAEDTSSRDEGSPDTISAFARERALWAPIADRTRARFSVSERVRHGELYNPTSSLVELEAREVPVPPSHEERRLAWAELARAADLPVRFDADGWVAHQATALEAARANLR